MKSGIDVIMNFIWTVFYTGKVFDQEYMNKLNCYDSECLLSTFWVDEMLDYIDNAPFKCSCNGYTTNDDLTKFTFELFTPNIEYFKKFKSGGYKTSF